MSVTTTGIKGYEYQYKATVLVGLLYLTRAVNLFVEEKGSEDATLTITEDSGVNQTIEIQVKNTLHPVDLPLFTEWLCHFPPRSAKENLLSKITNSLGDQILFITSARSQDDTAMFVKFVSDISVHTALLPSDEWIRSFEKELISNTFTGNTTLQKQRNSFCRQQGNSLMLADHIQNALKRILIWEKVAADDLEYAIEKILNTNYRIPQSQANGTLFQLLEAVRKGRDQKTSIIPAFNKILSENRGESPVLDLGYQTRKEEHTLSQQLHSKGVLLLTGRTQCGKSELAKRLADKLYQAGYTYRITSEVNTVESFFNLNAIEDKICVLEDPFGHIEPMENSFDALKKLESLITNKRSNHKLIVTSREEILAALGGASSLTSNKLGNTRWENITLTDRSSLVQFWHLFSHNNNLDNNTIAKLEEYLKNTSPDSLLQIGELLFLTKYDQDLSEKSIGELLHIARQTSLELSAEIISKRPEAAELLSVICCCSTPTTSVSLETMGYILSNDNTTYSILDNSFFSSGGHTNNDPFPHYKTNYSIPEKWQQELEYLEERGLVIIRGFEIWIAHPNYFEAGKFLLTTKSSIRQSRIINYFRKAIGSLSNQNSLQAIYQLYFLSTTIANDYLVELWQLSFFARRSIFPAVRDQSLLFLISNVKRLDAEMKNELESLLNSSDPPSSHIFWHGNIAYISEHSNNYFSDRFYKLPKREFQLIKDHINSDQPVSSLDAWNFIRSIGNDPKKSLSSKEEFDLMQYDEVFIRKRVVNLMILRTTTIPRIDVLNLIFSDQHPSVKFEAIRSIVLNWKKYSASDKQLLKAFLISAIKIQSVAIRSNRFLTNFENHKENSTDWGSYSHEDKKGMWNIWAELYIESITQLPPNLFLDTVGFGETINNAFEYLDEDLGMLVLQAWYSRIDQKIQNQVVLDEYEMAISDTLIGFTKGNPMIRSDLFQKLLTYDDTSFIISSLKWSIAWWEFLTIGERGIIVNLIKSSRKDIRWVKAIALTREKNPPAEIQQTLLGVSDLFNQPPEIFIKAIDSQLLEDCLKCYFGHPQPLWWLATQYNNIDFWQKVVEHVLSNTISPFFEICLRELTSWGLNGASRQWKNSLTIWDNICRHFANKRLLADRLLYDISRINCVLDKAKAMFNTLIDCYRIDGKEDELVNIVRDNIEMLQQTGHGYKDLLEIIEFSFLDQVYQELLPDFKLYGDALFLKDNIPNRKKYKKYLKEVSEKKESFRFGASRGMIKRKLVEYSLLDLFEEDLDKIPDRIKEIGEAKKNLQHAKYEYKLPDWIGIN